MGTLGFGVYLCHVLFNEAIITVLNHWHVADTIGRDIGVFLAVAMIAFPAAWLMRRTPGLRWLIP